MSEPEIFRLTFRSFPAVVEAVGALVSRYRARNFRLGPAGAGPEGAIFSTQLLCNALLVWFCALDPAEQERILRDGMARLAPLTGGDAAPPPGLRAVPRDLDSAPEDTEPRGARGKQGG